MKTIQMTQDELELWSSLYEGNREGITFEGDMLVVPDKLFKAVSAIDYSKPAAPSEEAVNAAIQAHLDETARQRRYDNMASAVSFRGDPNPQFAAEAEALFLWRSDVWTSVKSGPAPSSIEKLIEGLPKFTWPDA